MYQLLKQPNLTVQGRAGYCLEFTQNVWSVPHIYPKAVDAWNDSVQHTDLPTTSAPVYWTFRDPTDGIQYGHIATFVPSKGVYSSPFDTATGSQWFPSIQAMTDRIKKIDPNVKYLGWSETLSKVQLIKEGDMPITTTGVDKLIKMALKRDPTTAELNNPDYQNNPQMLIDVLWANGGEELSKQPTTPMVQVLKPGTYKVQ